VPSGKRGQYHLRRPELAKSPASYDRKGGSIVRDQCASDYTPWNYPIASLNLQNASL
jgi:hypothetical protein